MKLPKQVWFILFTLFFTLIIILGSAVYFLVFQALPSQAFSISIIVSVMSFFFICIIFITFYLLFEKSSTLPDDKIIDLLNEMLAGNFTKKFDSHSDDDHFKLKSLLNELSDHFEKIDKNFEAEVSRRVNQTQGILHSVESQNEVLKSTMQELEKFKLAVEEAPIHIIITDGGGKIIYANKASSKITGYSKTEMLGQNPSLWGKQMPKEYYLKMWKTIKDDRIMFKDEVLNRRKNNQLYDAEIRIAPVLSHDNNEPLFYVGIEEDISERKLIDKMKTDFISLASHQLRTPVTAIRWLSEELLDKKDSIPESVKKIIDEIHRSALRMVDLIKTLLNVSRLQSGKLPVNPREINLSEMLEEIIRNIELRFYDKNPNIIFKIQDGLNIISDPDLLSSILENLISNAVKYSNSGSQVGIIIDKSGDNMIVIKVDDNGIGIPDDDKDKIFSRFFRAKNAQSGHEQGSGLGLFMVRQIVNVLGGVITFESKDQRGTRFIVTLPIKYQVKNV